MASIWFHTSEVPLCADGRIYLVARAPLLEALKLCWPFLDKRFLT